VRLLRTISGLSVLAVCLAGCGGNAGSPSAAVETPPLFVMPSEAPTPSSVPSTVPPVAGLSPSPPQKPVTTAPAATAPATPVQVKYTFPVKASNVDWHPTHGKYPATDLFADCGEPVVATTSGVVLEISLKDLYVEGSPDGPNNGGRSVSILGDDGVRYYGSHLSKLQSGIKAGVRVTSGQLLGKVGRTGNANNVCHLHYGISPPCAKTGDWKVRRGVIWPATFLNSWRKGGQKSPVATVSSWKKKNKCKA
jgi:peptidoglycan LD-endopeptidase LytH